MRFFFRLAVFILVAFSLGLAGTIFLATSNEPLVSRAAEITPAGIGRAKTILDKNDPRRLKHGAVKTIVVSQADLDLAANYIAQHYAKGGSRVTLREGGLIINASAQLPPNPIGNYVNIDAALTADYGLPRFEYLRVGHLPVPVWVANQLFHRFLAELGVTNDLIKRIHVADDRIAITYQWQANLPDKISSVLLPPEEQERIRVYHHQLVDVSRVLPSQTVSLTELMVPLFTLAEKRSRSADPIAENRAAILVLTFYVNGKNLGRVVPAAREWPAPRSHAVRLHGREDFPQHFTISAFLAGHGGGPLANAVGVYKEIHDARLGEKFSFSDLVADRAGTVFGEKGVKDAETAVKLQRQLTAGIEETDLMPLPTDMPDIREAEFKRRFGEIGSPKYNQMMAEIERRVASLPLYR